MGIERIAVLILLDKRVIPVVVETRKKLVTDDAGLGSCRIDKAFKRFPEFGSFSFLRTQVGNDSQCHVAPFELWG